MSHVGIQQSPTSVFIVNVSLVVSLSFPFSTSIWTSLLVSLSLLPGIVPVVSGPATSCSFESRSVHSTDDESPSTR
ncbi:hypothetical protein K458DRAFT_420376 [Lentithecium fluviatile CBS 122367]|uniref:Uncharacterized protein n=1 Tax=Lentithecium fluviatile CBS 122367 TaxID=1168545 RepID=A0A6G1ITN1_9PLEO|nr:hypothetical protein K458DRAFT_420376 [Lentithecium fluviatile CBS 122367]